mgnify:CR=1 FL=1
MRVLNKKGVSPIIAVLLLIVITVTAALLTYLWVLGYIGSAQKSGQPEQLEEKIKIDGVKVSDGTVTIYVRNIGSVRVVIQAAYILNATTGTVIDANTDLNVELGPGEVSGTTDEDNIVSVDVSGTYTSGCTYVAKVVTKKGTEASLAFTWP